MITSAWLQVFSRVFMVEERPDLKIVLLVLCLIPQSVHTVTMSFSIVAAVEELWAL